jgi:hypothetical protein
LKSCGDSQKGTSGSVSSAEGGSSSRV